jgi:diaminohydroxyphosphoribosylaminopyrimidine deaminase/5-amino-6-(5-phosphoribosylamino)uracil reductase
MPKRYDDEFYMNIALKLAELGRGFTSPNPMVGAVVVNRGRIVGIGYHKRKGEPHAEVRALQDAGELARDATLYVNLEPHSFHGATPPCTDAIIKAGIRRVVIATKDPNPKVNGKGIKIMRDAGIEVKLGILEDEAKRLNEAYFKWVKGKIPFVYLKLALTLDGFIADFEGKSKWISSESSREFVHRLRGEVDGIVVGVETVIKDDPELTPRHIFPAKYPVRIILDRNLDIPKDAKVLKIPPETILITTESAPKDKEENLKREGITVLRIGDREIPLRDLLKILGEKPLLNVLVEGGSFVASRFLKENLVDKLLLFYSPKVIGEGLNPFSHLGKIPINEAVRFEIEDVELVGDDTLIILKRRVPYE